MTSIVEMLWLIPLLPLLAAGFLAVTHHEHRKLASGLSIAAMICSFALSCFAFAETLRTTERGLHLVANFSWLQFGEATLKLGWVLDPLTACMLMMVTFVGTLIFIYSTGYMEQDPNYTRFFCFLSLFAAAMLGLVISNNLLQLFMCWELVGLASYLLIGFWYHKPSAAAAAKKAFITTRIGDIGFFLGILWLYSETGTLLFYDGGHGCLEESALTKLIAGTTIGGMAISTGISLLIFCGAVGKSGQVPLHVWLPDAMEGPTPVSALIHAATMVAAGVFLMARVYPLLAASPALEHAPTVALRVITWVGAITAVFAALVAVAQRDIKRILAYSTVSQLGYMFLGLGVGGVPVAMFHLITHAFFKALLFLGAGSVIHGCHEEQDIWRMGGLRKYMPVTFITYAIGMMALAGVPLFFSGFWSKDEILHSAWGWQASRWPFYLGVFGAFLTAFYMTRQVYLVFFGAPRLMLGASTKSELRTIEHDEVLAHPEEAHEVKPHESPTAMLGPLVLLAAFTILLSLVGTPVWPAFEAYLNGHLAHLQAAEMLRVDTLGIMLVSTIVVALGIAAGWFLYSRAPVEAGREVDALERLEPDLFAVLKNKFFVDEVYQSTVIRLNALAAWGSDWLDRVLWDGLVTAITWLVVGLAWVDRALDEFAVNLGFDKGCSSVRGSGSLLSRIQNGQVQSYLKILGVAVVLLALLFIWGTRP
jgi:NADH-quinone oxidoreductase subunit L